MKRGLIIVLFAIFALATFAWAQPKVAIVRGNAKVLKDSWTHDRFQYWLPRSYTTGFPRYRYWDPEWTPESEQEIEEMVIAAIEYAEGWPVQWGDTVLIKVNTVIDLYNQMRVGRATSNELLCMTTDARVARAVALKCKESGARKIYIAEAPACADAISSLMAFGHAKYIPELSWEGWIDLRGMAFPTWGEGDLVSLNDPPYVLRPLWPWPPGSPQYFIPSVVLDARVVISVSPIKTHSCAGFSATLKNIGIGCPPARIYGAPKMGLPHKGLHKTIVDVCGIVDPDYAVISGIYGGEGYGPDYCDPVYLGLVIAGSDLVAVDATAVEVMGFIPSNYGTLTLAQTMGLGQFENFDKEWYERKAAGDFVEVPDFSATLPSFKDVPKYYPLYYPLVVEDLPRMYRAPKKWGGVEHWPQ